jgi:hypothetical protein
MQLFDIEELSKKKLSALILADQIASVALPMCIFAARKEW